MVIKFEPIFKEKIWGGSYFSQNYKNNLMNNCGEVWGISGHLNGSNKIVNGLYKGMTLRDLFVFRKELFGNPQYNEFPILIKLIDANEDLSIQVHPNDDYAQQHHNSFGKTECWYVVDTTKDHPNLIIGHTAKDKKDLHRAIKGKEYGTLLKKYPIKKGDLFDIPAGTIHAICEGAVILEVQQSSDITYRFYDYDRLENGKLRELHLDDALNVVDIPSKEVSHTGENQFFKFQVSKFSNSSTFSDRYGDYYVILEGSAIIDDVSVTVGDFFMISANSNYSIKGDFVAGKISIR